MPQTLTAPLTGVDGIPIRLLRALRLVLRAALLIAHLLFGLALALLLRLDFTHRLVPEQLAGLWSRMLLRLLGIELRVTGAAPLARGLLVANHISWLDIPLIVAAAPTRFVSKSEVQNWPVAGWLADASGTFYIRRGKNGARPLLNRLVPYLAEGGNVTIFPEGTTTSGAQVLGFHPRLFAAAAESGCAVQPLTLQYGLAPDGRDLAPFIGDDELVTHILRLLRNPGLDASLHFGAPLPSADQTREQLAQLTHAAICTQLGVR